MFGRLSESGVATAAVTMAAMIASAGPNPGYLAAVGPVTLRFRAPARCTTNLMRPALPSPDAEPAPPAAAATVEPLKAEPKPAPAATPPPAPAAVPTVSAPAEPTGAPAGEPVVSPQMLLRYFNRSTNGVGSGIIAPVDFTPPAARPASSTATYSTDPK